MDDLVKSFDNMEEAIAYIERTRESFDNLPIKDWQREMKPGDCFVQFVGDKVAIPCDIYGEVVDSEYEEDRALMEANPHLRLCKCYSEMCIEGEYGNIYIATMSVKIRREHFERARTLNWPPIPG